MFWEQNESRFSVLQNYAISLVRSWILLHSSKFTKNTTQFRSSWDICLKILVAEFLKIFYQIVMSIFFSLWWEKNASIRFIVNLFIIMHYFNCTVLRKTIKCLTEQQNLYLSNLTAEPTSFFFLNFGNQLMTRNVRYSFIWEAQRQNRENLTPT